jgi:hydrogenase-4 component F
MIFFGLLSMITAAVFMVRQRDFKRMLAYSSVEHMGILVFGVGLGGAAIYGVLLHVINNALAKGVLFLSAGNIHRAYGSKLTDHVTGAMRGLPLSGSLFLAGFFAGCGSPPFGPFVSEFSILAAAFRERHFVGAAIFLTALMAVFLGMGATVLGITLGKPSRPPQRAAFADGARTGAPIVLLMGLVLLLGVYMPPFLGELVNQAAASLAMN